MRSSINLMKYHRLIMAVAMVVALSIALHFVPFGITIMGVIMGWAILTFMRPWWSYGTPKLGDLLDSKKRKGKSGLHDY